ncbi:MAG TPA: type II toxin-antitoxin system ParD family antitoxin [Methylomirabilota bacterium]|nr:type II toxin-antitoxin system ParD family antitoxin [Methylomirabilota bacterium]
MSVDLAPHVEALIREKIEAGPYRTADEVIHEALQALEERERLQRLRAMLQVGLDQLDRGEGVEFTPEWSAQRRRLAVQRAEAGEKPHPDVWP